VEFLSWLALILLTLVGYAAGAVLALWTRAKQRVRTTDPSLLDMIAVVLLWVGIVLARSAGLGRWWALLVGFGIAFVIGFILARLQPRRDEARSLTL
jgi:membrane associated rhomboid family serine protease